MSAPHAGPKPLAQYTEATRLEAERKLQSARISGVGFSAFGLAGGAGSSEISLGPQIGWVDVKIGICAFGLTPELLRR